jgi:hypothetical protein
MNARGLLSLNCIGHWDFFRTTTIPELMKMKYPFPLPIARQMMAEV